MEGSLHGEVYSIKNGLICKLFGCFFLSSPPPGILAESLQPAFLMSETMRSREFKSTAALARVGNHTAEAEVIPLNTSAEI